MTKKVYIDSSRSTSNVSLPLCGWKSLTFGVLQYGNCCHCTRSCGILLIYYIVFSLRFTQYTENVLCCFILEKYYCSSTIDCQLWSVKKILLWSTWRVSRKSWLGSDFLLTSCNNYLSITLNCIELYVFVFFCISVLNIFENYAW